MVTIECESISDLFQIVLNFMEIEIVKNGGAEIEDYILRSRNSLVYTNPAFINLITSHLNATSWWMIARDPKTIRGVLPFVESQTGEFGTVLNSLPFYGSNGGVVQEFSDNKIKKILIKDFFVYANEQKACSATIVTNPLLEDNHIYADILKDFILDERIGQITHLPQNPEDLIRLFDEPRPRNIRRAIKERVQVTRGNQRDSIEFLYNLHVENMKAIGGLSKSWDFFEKLLLDVPTELWSVYIGTIDGKPVAALLLFYFNRTVEYFTPVIHSEHRNTQALALIIYEAMKDAVKIKKCNNWNWGGTWLNQTGVYDFKKRWGTKDYPYFYYTKLFRKEVLLSNKDALLENYPGFFVLPFKELNNN